MNVILDTNIIRQDLLLKANKFEALFSYLKKTNSDLIIPEVVLRESINLYKRELQTNMSKVKSLSEKIISMSLKKISPLNYSVDIEKESELYEKYLKAPEGFGLSVILPINPNDLNETIDRLISGKKPAGGGGKEFRDVIIWLSIKDYLTKNKSHHIAFISANTKEFADDSGEKLTNDLKDELAKENLDIIYYNSIENFLKVQASKIDFITEEWLLKNIPDEIIYKLAYDKISIKEQRFERYADRKLDNFTGYINVLEVTPSLSEYFVFDMHSDGIYLNLTYYAEVEIEVEIDNYEIYEDDIYESRYKRSRMQKESSKTLNPEVYIFYSARITDEKVSDIELDDWDLA